MAFEGLRDRLKEQWSELAAKIQETSAYNTAREQFESQTPIVQKTIIGGGLALTAFFILSFPLGYLSSSRENMAVFEENRGLIQGLLRASRTAKEASPLPPPLDEGSLRTMVDRALRDKKLLPEQIGDMQAIPGEAFKDVPAGVVQNGIAVQVKKLNVNQIMEIGNAFQNLAPGTKLIGLDVVQTAGQTHYYDIIARVASFGIPSTADLGPEPPAKPAGRKRPPTEDGE